MKKLIAACFVSFLWLYPASSEELEYDNAALAELRILALNQKKSDLGLNEDNFPFKVFGVLMETGLTEESYYSLLAFGEGSTSLYFSNGGGILGAGEIEKVREFSEYLISGGNHFLDKASRVITYPTPKTGRVIFYFITDEGVFSYEAAEDDLGNEKDELSALFFEAHEVISQIRLNE